jgi:hypothetical protein
MMGITVGGGGGSVRTTGGLRHTGRGLDFQLGVCGATATIDFSKDCHISELSMHGTYPRRGTLWVLVRLTGLCYKPQEAFEVARSNTRTHRHTHAHTHTDSRTYNHTA